MARVNGYLQQVAYTPGEIVKKGQLLFVIEPSQYEDAVEQAEAALKTAQAQYDYAENNYTRMKEAAQSDAISTIDLIQAESKLEQSRASVRNVDGSHTVGVLLCESPVRGSDITQFVRCG